MGPTVQQSLSEHSIDLHAVVDASAAKIFPDSTHLYVSRMGACNINGERWKGVHICPPGAHRQGVCPACLPSPHQKNVTTTSIQAYAARLHKKPTFFSPKAFCRLEDVVCNGSVGCRDFPLDAAPCPAGRNDISYERK